MSKFKENLPVVMVLVILAALTMKSIMARGADKPIQRPVVGFEKHVRPIFVKNCASCHNAQSGLPNWLDYRVAYEKRELIRTKVLETATMPPASGDGFGLNAHERAVLKRWLEDGAQK